MYDDRREHERHPVSIDGKIIFAEGRRAFDCLIVDLSFGGARAKMHVDFHLPSRVYLWQTKTGVVLDCEVRWQESGEVGLRFIDSCGRQVRRTLFKALQAPKQGRVSRWLQS